VRVVLVSRRFWPQADATERVLGRLVEQFVAQGASCTVLTARWDPGEPKQFSYRGAEVVRLPPPRSSFFGPTRYLRGVSRWLRENAGQYEAVCVSRIARDLATVKSSLGSDGPPIFVRCELAGPDGDVALTRSSTFAAKVFAAISACAQVITPSETGREELIAWGVDPAKICLLENGAPVQAPPSPALKQQSRCVLYDAHELFSLRDNAPLAVYLGPFLEHQGVFDLVAMWRQVVSKLPHAKLWMIGEGSDGPRLWQAVKDEDLQQAVILPGVFDDITDVLRAADVLLAPAHAEHSSYAIQEAIGAGLPVVASALPGYQAAYADAVRWVAPGGQPGLLEALLSALKGPRPTVCPQMPTPNLMAQQHLDLIAEVIERRAT